MKDRICELMSPQILVIDSLESVLGLAKLYLEYRGYDVVAVNSSTEALAAIQSEPESFALVLAPSHMPELTGAELAQEIACLRSDLPIVLVSSASDHLESEHILPKNVRSVLKNAVDLPGLAHIVQQILTPRVKPSD